MYGKSLALFEEAQKYMPGGVNSPVRAFKSMDKEPLFIERGQGSHIFDADGKGYIDYVNSWGPLILGHAHPKVLHALADTAAKGTSFGAPTSLETEMARLLVEMVPSLEMVRMVNSGTEAVMSALRVARGYTKRDKIVKFSGCYHGHGDSLLIKAGSGVSTLGLPDSPGVTRGTAQDTIVAPYNDLSYIKEVFAGKGEEIAAVVLEPVAGNMGLVMPKTDFLAGLRKVTRDYGALLIFDEVMTGFRVALGGAQELFDIEPDLTTLGKVIGGGLPVAAYGGKKEIMAQVAPLGPIYQAGTLSGNPLAMAAGIETLNILKETGVFETIVNKTKKVTAGLEKAAVKHSVPATIKQVGTMFCTFFNQEDVFDFASAARSNMDHFKVFFFALLQEGVYIAPSQFESCFLSLAHTDADLENTAMAADTAFAAVAKEM